MKKILLMAFAVMSLTAVAQHVTPLSIEIADPKIDSLRTLYLSEPVMYRASLDVASQALAKNADELKAAKNQLKVEQAHAKQVAASLKNATKMAVELRKLYSKEESELKTMQKAVTRQQEGISRQTELNQETRNTYLSFLAKQQSELSYALREVADRQRAIADLESSIQKGQTILQTFNHETEVKAKDLAALEALHKQRVASVKSEQQAAKKMQ